MQRAHQPGGQRLAQRVRHHQFLELGHQRLGDAGQQVGVDALLDGGQPQLFQPLHLDAHEWLEFEIRQRPATPQRLCASEDGRGPFGVSLLERRSARRDLPLEELQVELAGFDAQQVARRT